jgi:hypothetical protein
MKYMKRMLCLIGLHNWVPGPEMRTNSMARFLPMPSNFVCFHCGKRHR